LTRDISVMPKYEYFRCITCETRHYRIHELAPIKETPIIGFHKDAGCELEYFTDATHKAYLQSITPDSNTSSSTSIKKKRSMKWFIHKGRIFNRMGFYFSRTDYPEISPESFRGYVHDAIKKGLIERVKNSQIPSYRVVGELSDNKERGAVTLKRMGVGLEFEKILRDACLSYPKIHDIRLKVPTTELYKYLSQSRPAGKKNGRINLGKFQLKPYTFATISAYPNTVEIIIECSRLPIIYDTSGAQELIAMLGELRGRLMFGTHYQADGEVPSVLDWIVTNYHFNKDGRQYSGKRFEIKVKEMCAGMFRFYSKRFPDGVTRPRLEQIRSPNTKVLDEIAKMIKTDNFVRNTAGIKLTHEEARQVLDIIPESSFVPDDINQFSRQPIMIMMSGTSFFNPIQDGVFSF